jgi:3-phenylpropionate/cinnamic acid dioxygenase small subunit
VERTLKIVQARHAIEDVLHRYAAAIDTADLEAIGPLLHGCALFMPDGAKLDGGAAIVEHYRKVILFYDDDERVVEYRQHRCSPRTRHVITNVTYRFSPDVTVADVHSCFTVYQNLDGENPIVAGGRYFDRFAATISGWQMTERAIHVDHPGDMSRHVRPVEPGP